MAIKDKIKKAKKPFGEPNAADDGKFSILIPEGAESGKIPASDQYIGQLMTLTKGISKGGKGNPQWIFNFQIVKGKYAGMDFQLYCPLTVNAMWKIADTLAALGIKYVPGKQTNFDRSAVIGTLVRLIIKDDKNQDGTRDVSRLVGVLPHPDGAGKKAKKRDFVPAEDDDEEEDQDQDETTDDDEEDENAEENEEGDDEDEAEGDEDEEGEDEAGDDEDEDNEAGEDDEDDEGWEEPPPSPPKGSKKARKARTDEDEEGDEEYAKPKAKRRSGPAVEERPVKRGPGRPAKKAGRGRTR